jgi:DNA polymerase-1
VMIAMFASGADFHSQTARMISKIAWGIEQSAWDAMTPEEQDPYRSVAKSVNFQIHYDREPEYTLARNIGATVDEARKVVAAVRGQFKVLGRKMEAIYEAGLKHGGVFAYWQGEPANWRPLPALGEQGDDPRAKGMRRNAGNACWNTVVQGSSAHFATASLHPIQQAYDDNGLDANVVLTVHDSIMTLVAEKHLEEAARIKRQVMTGWKNGAVPLVVDFKKGTAWGSLEKYKLSA